MRRAFRRREQTCCNSRNLLAPRGQPGNAQIRGAVRRRRRLLRPAGVRYARRAGQPDGEELQQGCIYAHARGKKVYLTLNTLPTNEELKKLPQYIQEAAAAASTRSSLPTSACWRWPSAMRPMLSGIFPPRPASPTTPAATAAYELGAKRVVLARELPLMEIAQIRDNCPRELELEAFVHGAMCMSVSGRCLLSSYMTGRSGNRGECAQPCRWKYALVEEHRPGQYMEIGETPDNGSYILNANDLCTAPFLDLICKAGVDSLKIEGAPRRFTMSRRSPAPTAARWIPTCATRLTTISACRPTSLRSWTAPATATIRRVLFWQRAGAADPQPHLRAPVGFHRHRRRLGRRRRSLHAARQVCGGGHAGSAAARRRHRHADPGLIENEDGQRVDATPHPMMRYTIPCETPLMPCSLLRMRKQEPEA